MADTTAQNTYSAPPDFLGRQNNINTAYNTALTQLQAQQSNLYNQMGYVDGSTQLDTGNQYGSIQQLLHSTGSALTADDEAEHARGLNSDSGLGAQRQRLIQYQSGLQKNDLGQTFQQNLTGIGNNRQTALQQYNTDTTSNGEDQAQWNATQNAQNDAIANYNRLLQSMQPNGSYLPGGGVQGSTPSPAASAGPREYIPASAPTVAASKSKPGKVTISRGRVVGGV